MSWGQTGRPGLTSLWPCGPQDPEVQKHATQILRKMLQQEEAELQVGVRAVRRKWGWVPCRGRVWVLLALPPSPSWLLLTE